MTDSKDKTSPKDAASDVARPIKPRYQVFISSTFTDLSEERKAVTWAVLKAKHIPAGMENFPAADDRGWATIQRAIDQSDYYVLLLAGRYGSFDETIGMSWTEREYEYAQKQGIPVLAFLRRDSAITKDKADSTEEAIKRLEAFKKKVKGAKLIKEWSSEHELTGEVVQALRNQIDWDEEEGRPRPGWYRGGTIPDARVLNELARLSAENSDLRKELESLRRPAASAKLELGTDLGDTLDQLEIKIPRYRYSPPAKQAGMHMAALLDTYKSEEVQEFLYDAQECFSLKFLARNTGNAPATGITLKLKVHSVRDIDTSPPEPPKKVHAFAVPNMGGLAGALRERHSQVDRVEPVVDGVGAVLYRMKSVSVGGSEVFPRIYLLAKVPSSCKVEYELRSLEGVVSNGEFEILLKANGVQPIGDKQLDDWTWYWA